MASTPLPDNQDSLLYKAVLQQSHDGIIIINNRGIIQKTNPAIQRIFGYSDKELLNKNISMLMPNPHAEQHDQYLKNYVTTRHSSILNRHIKLNAKKKSGEIFPIDLSVSEIQCDGSQLFSGLIKDISAEEKAKQQLEKSYQLLENSNKELEAFAYSISHDLRTPLRGIDGFSMALLEDFSEQLPANAIAYIERIRVNANKMGELISGLLDLSRHSQEPLRYESVNLSELAQSSFEQLRTECACAPQLSFNCTRDIIAMGDRKLLSIVIDNLMNNALKYTQNNEHAVIEFGEMMHDNRTTYFIKDNGVGFDMRHQQKLFQVFQRLHRNDEYNGNGIGLATVQRILQRHDGHIWAEAEINKGASFYFTLN